MLLGWPYHRCQMNLRELTSQAFANGGLLSKMGDTIVSREGQAAMAQAVAQVVQDGGALVVEAGTGTGKTYAYLLPALLSGKRVLVSTATKTLQDQLHGRDIPALSKLMNMPVRLALLKGRSSYLCLLRLGEARQAGAGSDRGHARTLARIERWSQTTQTGDMAELEGLDERSPVLPAVTSTRDNCIGSECEHAKTCHVNLARRQAMAADVVVVNHHLFFADMAVRESGVAELLPTVDVVILDEAHGLNETGIQFLGSILSSHQVLDLAHDCLAAGLAHARGLCEWQALAASLENAMRDLRLATGIQTRDPRNAGSGRNGVRINWFGPVPDNVIAEDWDEALANLRRAAFELQAALDTVSEMSPDFVRLHTRTTELVQRCDTFAQACPNECVRWLDAGPQLRLVQSPLDVAEALKSRVWPELAAAQPDAAAQGDASEGGQPSQRSWIFTSATLGDDESLSWFTQACGLQAAQVLRVSSPFDYPAQAALYVPTQFPQPSDPAHSHAVAALVGRVAGQLGGRTLVLTTSLRALQAISESLAQHLPSNITVLVQGTAPKRELIERFRRLGQGEVGSEQDGFAIDGAVLVGSASLWEGVDLPGVALQAVVIDKLPFPSPGDPLVQARSRRIQQLGNNPFAAYHLAEAAVALKQGAGRLIRHESDLGALIITDTRLATSSYSRRLLQALPPMRRLADEAELANWLGTVRQYQT